VKPPKHAPRGGVFLSHSSKDRAFVERLAAVLKSHGVKYWYSAAHIAGATQWHDEIGRALQRSEWFLLILTPNSVRSDWVKHELLYALNETRYKARIIPLLARSCKFSRLSWTLKEFQFLDFREDFHQGCRKLSKIWGKKLTNGAK